MEERCHREAIIRKYSLALPRPSFIGNPAAASARNIPLVPLMPAPHPAGYLIMSSGVSIAAMSQKRYIPQMMEMQVEILVDKVVPAGMYSEYFDGSGLCSGMYLIRLVAGEHAASRRCVIIRDD